MRRHSRPSVVVLTQKSSHAAAVLESLRAAGLPISAILLERRNPAGALRRARRILRSGGASGLLRIATGRAMRSIRPPADEPWWADGFYAGFAPLAIVPDLAGPAAVATLRDLVPDLVVLGSAPLLPPAVFEIPRLGTLNGHPGWLPQHRGHDGIGWAVLDGGTVGVTVHRVDRGIDTGPILARRRLAPERGTSLVQLEAMAERTVAALLANVAADVLEGRLDGARPAHDGAVPAVPAGTGGRPRRPMRGAERRAAEAALVRAWSRPAVEAGRP